MSREVGAAATRTWPTAVAGALLWVAFAVPFVAFGGRVVAWAVAGSSAAVAAAALLLFATRPGARIPPAATAGALLVTATAAAGLVPLPGGLAALAAPDRARLEAAVPADMDRWPAAVETARRSLTAPAPPPAPAEPASRPVAGAVAASFDPARTRFAVAVLACWLGALLVLAAQRGPKLGLGVLAATLPVVAAGCVYGLATSGSALLYGRFEPAPNVLDRPYGTFWNPNHFAALAAMSCPPALALGLSRERAAPARVLGFACLVPLVLAVLDAGSRGGLLAGGVGAGLLGLGLLRRPGTRLVGVALLAATAGAAGLGATVFAERLVGQSLQEATDPRTNAYRLQLYGRQLDMVARSPFLGIGSGAFRTAHATFKQTAESIVPNHGEGDWFEAAAETGVPGLAGWVLLLGGVLASPLRAVVSGRAPPLLVGLVAGSLATLLHAAVDFHHREPAVALVSVLLATTAGAWSRERALDPRPAARSAARAGALLAALGLMACALVAPRHVHHDRLLRQGQRAVAERSWEQLREVAESAAQVLPDHGEGWALLALAHEALARPVGPGRVGHRKRAVEASVRALRCTPATLGAARRAGSLLLAAGALRQASAAATLALEVAPGSAPAHELAGRLALLREDREEALDHLAFAYLGIPEHRLSGPAARYARMLHAASDGDPERLLEAVASPVHQAWYLAELARAGLGDEVPAHLATALRHAERAGSADGLRPLLGPASLVASPESAAVARKILPGLREPHDLVRAARALAGGGERELAREVLREVADRHDLPEAGAALLRSLEGVSTVPP